MFAKFKLYILGGAAFAAIALVSYLLWQLWALSSTLSASEEGRILATAERDRVVEANKLNTAALQTLAANQALNNKYLVELSDDLDRVRTQLATKSAARDKIEKENPDVKNYLDTPIPPALRMPAK